MNRYGHIAQEHWQRWLPTRYAEITDKETFFKDLGESVTSRIAELTPQLAGEDPQGEEYLQKLGRLNAAQQQAEEIVLREMVLLDPEPGADPDEEQQTPQPTAGEWTPMREDPQHPWWQQASAEQEDLDLPPKPPRPADR